MWALYPRRLDDGGARRVVDRHRVWVSVAPCVPTSGETGAAVFLCTEGRRMESASCPSILLPPTPPRASRRVTTGAPRPSRRSLRSVGADSPPPEAPHREGSRRCACQRRARRRRCASSQGGHLQLPPLFVAATARSQGAPKASRPRSPGGSRSATRRTASLPP